jgi:hypothetical protein
MINIRLKVGGESFWASQYPDLPKNQAEINNYLLNKQYHFGDRVEFDEDRNVVRLVKTRAQVRAEINGTLVAKAVAGEDQKALSVDLCPGVKWPIRVKLEGTVYKTSKNTNGGI